MDNKIPFRPMRGVESKILASEPVEGYVWFATDTRKIFYSNGTDFIPMGGNSGIYYGKMVLPETPEEGQVEFNFFPEDIEGNEDVDDDNYTIPNVNDLIFNSPDNSFYRVVEIDKQSDSLTIIRTHLLTVAGGGGGSGGGGSINSGEMHVSRIGNSSVSIIEGQSCQIRFSYSAIDSEGEATGNGSYSLYVRGVLRKSGVVYQGENSLNIEKYLELGTNAISLQVKGDIGSGSLITQTKIWSITVTSLNLTWNYDETIINTNEQFILNWQMATVLQPTTFIEIDSLYTIEIPYNQLNLGRDKIYAIKREDWGLTHGSHTVKLYAEVELDGVVHRSNVISHMVICVDENRGDTIIGIKELPLEINQYDILQIPIFLYNPSSNDNTVTATLRENGNTLDVWSNYENGKLYYWNYSSILAGDKVLSISSNGVEKTINLYVKNLDLSISEAPSYSFKIKSSDIISNSYLQNWSFNNIVPTFENFDWINGGLIAGKNGENYISIKAGSKLSFNYKPFRKVGNSDIIKQNGFTIKVIFKATNCRNYDGTILTIGTETDNVYLQLKANEAIYKPSGGQKLTVPYCENSYIEFELDIWPYGVDGKTAYIMCWLDGVPASASIYESNIDFLQTSNPKDIVVGSKDCDVELYMIKVYERHLSNDEHLANFIMDASTATEIISRYNRNNILDERGEISYQKLIEKNPNCDVYLYDIPRMTKNKKDKVAGCTYERYKGKQTPEQTATDVTIAVQGTSSAAYGLAAFNFNSTFKTGFIDYSSNPQGEHIDKWAMDENAMPIDDFNTKVNVASCEGVNNALNQEWYERYVPYVTEYKKKNPKSRNTMQFMNMGVVFIKDHNPEDNDTANGGLGDNVFKDTLGYINNPYYKLYSICNMGNIKRNPGVFSDLNNPYDVIMENPDNQSVYQQMTGNLDENGKLIGIWEEDKFYPLLITNTYFETEDSVAKEGKDYYQNNAGTYTKVSGLIPGETSVNGLYELGKIGDKAQTEVFEWRAVPSDLWDTLKEEHPDDPNYDFRKQAEDAWTGLVAWFASNNPNAATNKPIPAETYPPYTFKGYTSRSDRINPEGGTMPAYTPDNQILKGLQISTYAGTYTTDSYKRRMAKMLSECEEHLIMDEIVFHYLFIERHTLIDNVAKNTFWHTEDLQHWSMIKDYDNDTSDGNDNSGHLTLTYGYEVLDHVNHEESASYVFNAAASVWLHFIDGLIEARTRMYNSLDNDPNKTERAWDAAPYLKIFNDWQSSLPERVWVEDYYRKYLRPQEVYNTTRFLSMLEGGKKTHQRHQYETYQEAYMSSEYGGTLCQSSRIDIRANGKDINTMEFPMQMYADCYIRIAAGSGNDANVRERYHRSQELNIKLPVTGDANDMTTYFFLANYITSLKNIEMLKPKSVDISAATRLREFSMKRLEDAMTFYTLTNDTSVNSSKQYFIENYQEVSLPVGTELTDKDYYVLVNNNYQKTSDTISDGMTQYYIFNGYLPVSNPVSTDLNKYYEEIHSNQNLNLESIYFRNNTMLEKIEVIDCPRATNALNLTNVTNLNYLDVTNSGFTSISLAGNAPVEVLNLNNPERIEFNNLFKVNTFNMTYNNLNNININNIDNSPGLNSKTLVESWSSLSNSSTYNLNNVIWNIENANEISNNNINILDKLLIATPAQGLRSLGLTGKLYIKESAYNGENSLGLYTKYNINTEFNFPALDIIFEGSNAKLFTVSITDGDNNIVWSKKARKDYIIDSDFLSSSPYGPFNDFVDKITKKDSTAQYTFTFNNRWKVYDTNGNEIDIINSAEINNYKPNPSQDIIITPEFITNDREYTISVMVNGNKEKEISCIYGTPLLQALRQDKYYPNGPYQSDEELSLNQTYKFIGWSLRENNAALLNESVIVQSNMTIYAIFEEVNVHQNINENLFNITNDGQVSPKNNLLKGKITIPYSVNNIVVNSIGDFNSCQDITHIFFANNCQIKEIRDGCFDNSGNRNLKLMYLEPSDTIEIIGSNSFKACNLRIDLQSENYIIGGRALKTIKPGAFQNALHSNIRGKIVKIPGSVKLIGYYAFCWDDGLTNCTIQLGSSDEMSQWDILESVGAGFIFPDDTGNRYLCFAQNQHNISLFIYTNKYNLDTEILGKNFQEYLADHPEYYERLEIISDTNITDLQGR